MISGVARGGRAPPPLGERREAAPPPCARPQSPKTLRNTTISLKHGLNTCLERLKNRKFSLARKLGPSDQDSWSAASVPRPPLQNTLATPLQMILTKLYELDSI